MERKNDHLPHQIMSQDKPSVWKVLKQAGTEFSNDNVTKLAASLAYYTVFSIGPLVLIIISVAGIFFEENRISGELYAQISSTMGKGSADQVLEISNNMRGEKKGLLFTVIGAVVLAFGATGVFADMQDSLNYIWCIKAKPKLGIVKYLSTRLLSFSLVIGLGFLLMVSLVVNTVLELITEKLFSALGQAETVLAVTLNYALIFVIITLLFGVIYKVLPDAKIRWRDTLVGAGFTAILFMLGKAGIGYYLGTTDIATQYGAAASVILLLTWVYYSSIILYFGAEFTKVWALKRGKGIAPAQHAVFIKRGEEIPVAVHPKDDAKNKNREVTVIKDGVPLPSEDDRKAAEKKSAEERLEQERKAQEQA